MTTPLVLPSLLLALVLTVSAVFKLRDSVTSTDAFVSLRLPDRLRALKVPVLLPYAELLLAAALVVVPEPGYVVVTVVTVLLFVAYLAVIVRALGFEERVECGCFGRLGLGDVDRRTAVRNGVLVLVALVALGDAVTGHSVIERLVDFGVTEWGWLIGVAAAIVLTWLVVGRRSEAANATPTTSEPAQGDDQLDYERRPIPYGALLDRTTGESVPLFAVGGGRPALLVFVNLWCGPCVRTMEMLPSWAGRHSAIRTIAIPPGTGFDELPDLGPHVSWMEDPAATVARTFAVTYPSAVLFGVDGMLAGGPESGFDGISNFLDEISEQLAEAGVPASGAP